MEYGNFASVIKADDETGRHVQNDNPKLEILQVRRTRFLTTAFCFDITLGTVLTCHFCRSLWQIAHSLQLG